MTSMGGGACDKVSTRPQKSSSFELTTVLNDISPRVRVLIGFFYFWEAVYMKYLEGTILINVQF
jgi:hypothetical protein